MVFKWWGLGTAGCASHIFFPINESLFPIKRSFSNQILFRFTYRNRKQEGKKRQKALTKFFYNQRKLFPIKNIPLKFRKQANKKRQKGRNKEGSKEGRKQEGGRKAAQTPGRREGSTQGRKEGRKEGEREKVGGREVFFCAPRPIHVCDKKQASCHHHVRSKGMWRGSFFFASGRSASPNPPPLPPTPRFLKPSMLTV